MGYCGMASGEISIRYRDFHHMVRKEYNTPGIIKYPFWQMTAENPEAVYVCANNGETACPKGIEEQSICLNGDIGWVLQQIGN